MAASLSKQEIQDLKDYIKAKSDEQNGIPQSFKCDYNQTIYGTAKKGPAYNRYCDNVYTEQDALNWLIQTGGCANFVIQVRDTKDLTFYHEQVNTIVNIEWFLLECFFTAKHYVDICGYKDKIKMPYFYIGTPEENVDPSVYRYHEGIIEIYETIKKKAKFKGKTYDEAIRGIYFGSEVAQDSIDLVEVRNHLEIDNRMIWIPYFMNDIESKRIERVSNYKDIGKPSYKKIFDKIILQPSNFYYNNKVYKSNSGIVYENSILMKWDKIFTYMKNWPNLFGIELEFDTGLFTGRLNSDPPMIPIEKRVEFLRYFIYLYLHELISKKRLIIGIYSGGPNEHGYNNTLKNVNKHCSENHEPNEPKFPGFATGSDYSDLFAKNSIYDINKIIYNQKGFASKVDDIINYVRNFNDYSKAIIKINNVDKEINELEWLNDNIKVFKENINDNLI